MLSKNKIETKKIAEKILREILKKKNKDACVVGLYGELGSGKTNFTQHVAKHLGIKRKVNSPTFVIMKRYPLGNPSGVGFRNFFHLDAYRLKNEKELLYLGWKEILKNPENLVFIEWPENVKKIMPKKHHKVKISHTKEGHRKFIIKI